MYVQVKRHRSRKKRGCQMCSDGISPGKFYARLVLLEPFTSLDLCDDCGDKIDLVVKDGIARADDVEELFALAEEAHREAEKDARDDYLYEQYKERRLGLW